MNLLNLALGAGGGLLGSVLHCVTDYFDTRNKIAMLNAQMVAAEKTEAWKALSESHKEEAVTIPANAPVWIVSVMCLVDAAKQLTRPALTWASVGIIAGAYFTAAPAAQQEMQPEIIFGSFTAVFWWFGARYSRGSK